MGISFQQVSPTTVSTALALVESYYGEDGYTFSKAKAERAIRLLISKPTLGKIVLVKANGLAIGYYCITYGYSLQRHGRDAILDEIYIAKEHRRKGIGQRAIEHIVIELKRNGFKSIYLYVRKRNVDAQRFHRSNGFRKVKEAVMVRELSE